ncbi:PucR family transcriptional regulator [Micromonospora echinospora]|uniref:PucR family transcriptional regulator n=1 Tax=Micromonospora echinospora TaxID=1877 RepID=UPI0037AF75D3
MSGDDQRRKPLHTVLDRVCRAVPRLAATTVADVRRRHGAQPLTPAATETLRTIVSRAALWALSSVDDRADPGDIRESGVLERVDHGLTGPLVSQACNDMCQRTWQALVEEATDEEGVLLLERAARYLAAGAVLVEHVLTGLPTGQEIDARPGTCRQQVLTRLLDGERPPASLSAGFPVAATYAVLVVPARRPAVMAAVAARHGWLAAEHPGSVTVLVPVDGPDRRAEGRARARQAFQTLRPEHPAGLALPNTVEDIPAAVAEAREAVATLNRLGRHDRGLFQLDDVLLEAVLCRSPELAARLAGRLRPVAMRNPYLLETLAAFLDSDCERRELARQMFIHPNTLNHRLRRVSELTGLSLTSAGDLCLLKASLMAWQVTSRADGASAGRRPVARVA